MKTAFCEELKCVCVRAPMHVHTGKKGGFLFFYFLVGILQASMKRIGREENSLRMAWCEQKKYREKNQEELYFGQLPVMAMVRSTDI